MNSDYYGNIPKPNKCREPSVTDDVIGVHCKYKLQHTKGRGWK